MNILVAIFCIALFSLTVPFTRMAALETPAEAIIFFRLIGASIVCLGYALYDGWIPPRQAWGGIIATALGSVLGFASLTAFAMKQVPSGHAAVGLAAMPMATAVYSVLRDRINPGARFWLFATVGTLLSFAFFFSMNVSHLLNGDVLLVMAVFAAALGYVEGGRMSRIYSGKRVMSWSILATLPITIPTAIYYFLDAGIEFSELSGSVWFSFAYLALVSQSFGMFLWFKVLAQGPMEKIALVQLLQPFLTLLASIIFLNESVLWSTWIIAVLVGLCIVGANRERKKLVAA